LLPRLSLSLSLSFLLFTLIYLLPLQPMGGTQMVSPAYFLLFTNPGYITASCVFPFVYKNQVYFTCTSDGESSGKLWCSTTRNYDVDKKWTYCSKRDYDKPCVFPFIYKNFKFLTCTNLAEASGKFWCSTTDNYDRDRQWTYCPT
uniref:Fibronectin type-II domain-containing protein n=1 Tax=Gopherus agassizii TaxID=38772 RepID=A0A452GJ73_9SAUR